MSGRARKAGVWSIKIAIVDGVSLVDHIWIGLLWHVDAMFIDSMHGHRGYVSPQPQSLDVYTRLRPLQFGGWAEDNLRDGREIYIRGAVVFSQVEAIHGGDVGDIGDDGGGDGGGDGGCWDNGQSRQRNGNLFGQIVWQPLQ